MADRQAGRERNRDPGKSQLSFPAENLRLPRLEVPAHPAAGHHGDLQPLLHTGNKALSRDQSRRHQRGLSENRALLIAASQIQMAPPRLHRQNHGASFRYNAACTFCISSI